MPDNVVHLPRPSQERPQNPLPGLYFRVGRNQHVELLDVLGEGERGFFGIIIDAHYAVRRHRELRLETLGRGFDVGCQQSWPILGSPDVAGIDAIAAALAAFALGSSRCHALVHDAIDFLGAGLATVRVRRVEQHQALDRLGMIHCELRNRGPAEGVSNESEIPPAELIDEFECIRGKYGDTVGVIVGWRIGSAGAAVVDGDRGVLVGG